MEQKGKIEKIMARIRNLAGISHPAVDWEKRIDELALKVKNLSKIISKRRK